MSWSIRDSCKVPNTACTGKNSIQHWVRICLHHILTNPRINHIASQWAVTLFQALQRLPGEKRRGWYVKMVTWRGTEQVCFPCNKKLHSTKVFQHSLERKTRVKRAKFISATSQKIRRVASVPELALRICSKWRGRAANCNLKHFTFGSSQESWKPSKLTQLLQYMASLRGFCVLPAFLLLLSHEYWVKTTPAFQLGQNLKASPNRAFNSSVILLTAGADFVVILKLYYLPQINELKPFSLTMEALLHVKWFCHCLGF